MIIDKGLIIKKEYLNKIFEEGKIWEIRASKTNIRGRIALIESGSGKIVGEAELFYCSEKPVPKEDKYKEFHKIENLELLDKWKYAWCLKNVRKYKNPVPYNHPQGAVIWVDLKKALKNEN